MVSDTRALLCMIATLSGGSRAVAPGTQVCLSACPSMIIGRIWSQRKVIRGRGGLVRGLRRLIQILGGLIWGQTPDFERTDLRPESADLRPKTTERLDLRSMRPDLRSERSDMRPGRPHGGGDKQMDGRTNEWTDEWTKVNLCSTGLCPLQGRCPKSSKEKFTPLLQM